MQSILKLLFPAGADESDPEYETGEYSQSQPSWANRHAFLNVSVTPIECSIVCSTDLAREYFASIPTQNRAASEFPSKAATISCEDFVVISVEGEGLEAGQRVLELTSPLALAGMYVDLRSLVFYALTIHRSIFFITTYFSDYILVPAKSRGQVIRALEDRGFAFEKKAEAYVNPAAAHHRKKSSTSSFGAVSPVSPPPATMSELQARTFALLKRRNIFPKVETDIRLVQCAGRRDDPSSFSANEAALQLGLTKCLIHQPRFLSLTLTEGEPASLLLEKRLISHFGSQNVLLGSKEDYLIPITLDLEPLPLEATGIVCGVAGKLVRGSGGRFLDDVNIEMSYLSTAKAGTVMVEERDLERAMEALRVGENGVNVP